MKYLVFLFAALGVPPLAYLLHLNRRWMRYVFYGMFVAFAFYSAFKLNFFSEETYRGSSRGMEVSVIYLLAVAVIIAFALRHKFSGWIPDFGCALYLLYFLLCIPSYANAANHLYAWFETWKMMMVYIVFVAVYSYLKSTDDVDAPLKGFAFVAVYNFGSVVYEHMLGAYQPHGIFPHQNSMALAMHLLGTLFFARYLVRGFHGRGSLLYAFAMVCAGAALVRSFSRAAIALVPVSYAVVLVCLWRGGIRRMLPVRFAPLLIVGLVGFGALLPRIVERFVKAPESSADTRVELARCAREMIRDKPWFGVGINNWGIKINPPYPYAERAERNTNRRPDEDFRDGIVETVYLLVGAECGLPALVAMIAWFGWYVWRCFLLLKKLKGTRHVYIPAGMLGGFTAVYLQSFLEWVLRQQMNLILLMFFFAIIAYLDNNWRRILAYDEKLHLKRMEAQAAKDAKEAKK